MLLETAFICLALNTYHEAKNQSLVGQIATAQVVMNRVEDNRFPNTICEVVKQGPTRPSWEDPKKEYPIPPLARDSSLFHLQQLSSKLEIH